MFFLCTSLTRANEDLAHVEKIAGPSGQVESIFKISSDVFDKMARESGGDDAKLQKMIEDAKSNPEAFYNSWDAEQQEALKVSAEKIEKHRSKP